MKIRPLTSSLNRRRSLEATTPTYQAKRDYHLLLSSAEAMGKVDDKLYKLTETPQVEPVRLISSEVSKHLNIIKKSNNRIHVSKDQMNSRIRHLSVELSDVFKATKTGQLSMITIYRKIETLKKQIKETKELQTEALSDQEVYLNIQERMHANKIFLDVKKNYLSVQVKFKDLILEESQKIKAETIEKKSKNMKQFKDLNKSFNFFHLRTDGISNKLKTDQDYMDFIEDQRENRFKRQVSIAEKVGINERDRREKEIRESLLLHKMWYKVLTKILKRCNEKFSKIEMAFRKIKSVTGLDSISMIVEKFLTKEENLNDLTLIIKKNKEYLNEYASRNKDIQEQIKAIEILDKSSIRSKNIQNLNSEIVKLLGCKAVSQSKYLEISSLVKTLKEWISKMIKFFDPSFDCKNEQLKELVLMLRSKIHINIKPVDKFTTQDSSFFVTSNLASQGKSFKVFEEEKTELFELNHVDTGSSKSSWFSYEKKQRKSEKFK